MHLSELKAHHVSQLLEMAAANNIEGAKFVLLNITHGTREILMDEIDEITDHIQKAAGSTADVIWGYGKEIETRACDDPVRRLRRKPASTRVRVETVWGFGYTLKENDRDAR